MSESSASTPPLTLDPKAPPSAKGPRKSEAPRTAPRTAADWVLTLVAGNTAVFLLGFSLVAQQRLGAMTSDVAHMPFLTALVLRWYVPTGAGLLVALLFLWGLTVPTHRRRRLAGAAAMGVALTALCVLGLYLPLVETAQRVAP